MRVVPVDWAELEIAFLHGSPEARSYLDLQLGEVHTFDDEVDRYLDGDLERPPDWMRSMLVAAELVEREPDRFLRLPPSDGRADYRAMQDFIRTVGDDRLQEQLWRAIRGRGAFRRFRDSLHDAPAELERWYQWKEGDERRRLLGWLEEEGVQPGSPPPWADEA